MNNTSKTTPSGTQQPTIAKYVQTIRTGIRSQSLTRHCIGFVLRGTKYIYYGDVRHAVTRGKVFYLDIGTHYIEDIPDNGRSYEEVILFYSSQQLANILNNLNLIYQLTITNDNCTGWLCVAEFLQQCQCRFAGKPLSRRFHCKPPQINRADLFGSLTRRLLPQKQSVKQYGSLKREFRTDRQTTYFLRYLYRRSCGSLQHELDLFQKGVPQTFLWASSQMADQTTADAFEITSDLNQPLNRRNRDRLQLSQYLALY